MSSGLAAVSLSVPGGGGVQSMRGVSFGVPDSSHLPGSSSWGSSGIRGKAKVYDAEGGQELGSLSFSSSHREKGALEAELVLESAGVRATFTSKPDSSVFTGFSPVHITLQGVKHATLTGDAPRKGEYARESGGGGLTFIQPCWQPATQWLCCAFGCFFCTFGISACVSACMVSSVGKHFNISTADGSKDYPELVIKSNDSCSYSFEGLGESERVDMLLLLSVIALRNYCRPPVKSPPVASGGGGGGGM